MEHPFAAVGGEAQASARTDDDGQAALLASIRPIDKDVEEFLLDIDRRIEPHLKRALARVPNVNPLQRGVAHQITSGGKRIRAALCVASCELFGSPYYRSLNLASAIERHLSGADGLTDEEFLRLFARRAVPFRPPWAAGLS